MSVITSLNKRAANLAQKALRLGGDFVHPVSDDSGNTPDYNDPNNIISPDGHIDLPHTVEWGEGFPSTTFLDPETGLLTTKTEGQPPLDEGTTIYDIYADRAERMGDEPLYTYKTNGEWVTKTGNEVLADIRQIAKGLMHYGLKKGDGVAFMCRTSYEWDVFDAAVMACGGVLATIYDTDSAEQIRNIVNNSDSRLLVVETTDMRAKADDADKECPTLEHIICFENGGLDEIMAYGSGVSDEELDARIDSIKKTDLCSIVYTSGSTAAPKGVEMTHEHYCTTALNLPAYISAAAREEEQRAVVLPQAHLLRTRHQLHLRGQRDAYLHRAGYQDADRRSAGRQTVRYDRCSACAREGIQRCFAKGRTWRQGRGFRCGRCSCLALYEGS